MLDFKKRIIKKGGSSIIIYITGTKLTILNNTFYCLKQPVFRSLDSTYVLYGQGISKNRNRWQNLHDIEPYNMFRQ